MLLHGDHSGVILRQIPSFVAKNIWGLFKPQAIQLDGFCVHPMGISVQDPLIARLHPLSPVNALAYYIKHRAPIQHTEQLLMCYGEALASKPLSKKLLASWLCAYLINVHSETLGYAYVEKKQMLRYCNPSSVNIDRALYFWTMVLGVAKCTYCTKHIIGSEVLTCWLCVCDGIGGQYYLDAVEFCIGLRLNLKN